MFAMLCEGFQLGGRRGETMRQMAEMYFTVEWLRCPRGCGREVLKLYDERQCYDCWKSDHDQEEKQTRLGDYLRKTIGPYGLERYGFDNFQADETNRLAYDNARNFDPQRDSLFLVGPCGTGKTHLAGAIFKKCAGENRDVIWATPGYLSRRFRMKSGEEEEALLIHFASPEVLIIDDLGVGKETEFFLAKLYEIVGQRINAQRFGLVITSNLSLDDLARKFGDDRLTSRVFGHCRIYEVGGHDRRFDVAMAGKGWKPRHDR